jgi:hypothetical protein
MLRTTPTIEANLTARNLTAADLLEAKKLINELGGIDAARSKLKYLEELIDAQRKTPPWGALP